MIVFKNVLFKRNDRIILDNINFTINYNEKVAVLGGSGQGKTTILRLILGLLQADYGNILIDGKDITIIKESLLTQIRRNFSIVFQDGALFDSMTVKENVAFYMREYSKLTEPEIDFQVKKLLSRVDMEHSVNLMPEELSGGMLRRVAIARSLAAPEPSMFLYDEPTSDLDPISASKIRSLITSLTNNNRGFIIVTHEIMDAVKLAKRFMFLQNGQIIFDGNREQLISSNDPAVELFLEDWKKVL
jgi:phospholipid/cholesterol/gamma-HCH transport system ATP-binding protein